MLRLCNALSKRSSLFYRQIKAFSTTTTNCMIFDSLEEQKIPLNPTPEAMNWYSCGPTVYNHSHVGHARNYVSIDIVQRIFQNYFNKNLFIALGVTDIDDKIINTSNETKKHWKEVSQMYEESYFKDMTSLNVQKPHAILRVSEHIPDIIEFIKVLLSKNLAYVRPSGVYFNTNTDLIQYGKMKHTADLDTNDGNSYQRIETNKDKISQNDFALWKITNEDSSFLWDSPWGKGRPGWHIECSAMITSLFNDKLDVHAGGIDLKFPHHCNEIALTEGYFYDPSKPKTLKWPTYMIHSGHMYSYPHKYVWTRYIEGRKMSKSLKNFITIQEMLEHYDANSFRLMCLSYPIYSHINFTYQLLNNYKEQYSRMNNSLHMLSTTIYSLLSASTNSLLHGWTNKDNQIKQLIDSTKSTVLQSLYDNLNTPKAISSIIQLLEQTRIVIEQQPLSTLNIGLLEEIYTYSIQSLLNFGFTIDDLPYSHAQSATVSSKDPHQSMTIPLDELAQFRNTIRTSVLANPSSLDTKAILSECDKLRDHIHKQYNVLFIDGKDNMIWKYSQFEQSSPKEQNSKEKDIAKELNMKQKMKERVKELEEKSKINPQDMFKLTDLYSKFDEHGIPTHYKNGEEIKKSQLKKLRKEYEKQTKLYNNHLAKQSQK